METARRSEPVTLDAIRAALRAAAEEFLRRIAVDHPGETLYGFLFEIECSGSSAYAAVGTEEALTRFAERWIAGGNADENSDTLEKARAYLRWWGPEDGWYQKPSAEVFQPVRDDLLSRALAENLYEEYDGTLETLCIEALKAMDADGVFGRGADRERVGLGVCYIGGDNSEKEFLGWARQVNPQKVYRRMRREYLGIA